jgi:hypothetical protein
VCHSVAGRIWSIEESNYLTGNLTHDLPACNMVFQTVTLLHDVLLLLLLLILYLFDIKYIGL